jgi:hypothetical protein
MFVDRGEIRSVFVFLYETKSRDGAARPRLDFRKPIPCNARSSQTLAVKPQWSFLPAAGKIFPAAAPDQRVLISGIEF